MSNSKQLEVEDLQDEQNRQDSRTVYETAQDYIKDHNLQNLFQTLIAELLAQKPENPRLYLQRLFNINKDTRWDHIIKRSDLASMFDMVDATQQGKVQGVIIQQLCKTITGTTFKNQSNHDFLQSFFNKDEFINQLSSELDKDTVKAENIHSVQQMDAPINTNNIS